MKMCAQYYCIVINCVIFIPSLLAKPFSINEAIAEEVRGKQFLETTPRSKSADILETTPIDEPLILPTSNLQPHEARIHSVPESKKISSLKYRKAFKIVTPLKPKRLKRQQKLLHKRKIKTTKRAVDSNEVFNSKYIPLLKSLSILFDNFLYSSVSRESYEIGKNNYRRNNQNSKDADAECTCTVKSNSAVRKSLSQKATIAPTTTLAFKIPNVFETIATTEASTTPTYTTTDSYIRGFKRNKDIPLLFTRNPSSSGGDHNGIREGSSPTNNGSVERYISGYYGNNEHLTGSTENENIPQYYEEYPNSTPRDYASSNGSFTRIYRNGNDTRNPEVRRSADQTNLFTTEENALEKPGHKGENKLEARGYETESSTSIPNTDSGLRRHVIQGETHEIAKPTLTHKNNQEGKFNVTFNSTGYKRFIDRNGTYTPDDKKIRGTNEAITPSIHLDKSEQIKNKTPVLMIIGGYSVARDVNGENKLSEKSIHIHS